MGIFFFTCDNLLVPIGGGEKKGQVGIKFILQQMMMMIERKMAMVMIIFLNVSNIPS